VIVGVAQFRAAGRRSRRLSLSTTTDEVDRLSTGSGGSIESQPQKVFGASTAGNMLSPSSATEKSSVSVSSARASASSDIGYVSMPEQEQPAGGKTISDETDEGKLPEEGLNKFWGKMGQSFDSWVKSSVNSLATGVAAFADPTYYSPAGLIMSSYRGDYAFSKSELEDEGEDLEEEPLPPLRPTKSHVHRRLDFSNSAEPGTGNTNTMRLLRSVSFGNDTEIMSKLKELKKEEERGDRGHSVESNGSLETKVNQFYEGVPPTNPPPVQDSFSREITPVEEVSSLPPGLRSPACPIFTARNRENSCPGNLSEFGSSVSSPARTPVTQNDPLGALVEESKGVLLEVERTVAHPHIKSPKRTSSEGNIGLSQNPHGGVHPHQNQNGGMELTGGNYKGFHRSSTLPNYATSLENPTASGTSTPTRHLKLINAAGIDSPNGNVVSSLSAFGSSLKSFRYKQTPRSSCPLFF